MPALEQVFFPIKTVFKKWKGKKKDSHKLRGGEKDKGEFKIIITSNKLFIFTLWNKKESKKSYISSSASKLVGPAPGWGLLDAG